MQAESAHERIRYVIYSGHFFNAFYGLIRAHALSKTRLLPSYPGGDYRLLGELSLSGKFFEIPEYLFLRRLHPGSSSQNTSNSIWLIKYYKGESGHKCLPFWNLCADHIITIMSSKLSVSKKFSLVGSLLQSMHWSRNVFWKS